MNFSTKKRGLFNPTLDVPYILEQSVILFPLRSIGFLTKKKLKYGINT